MLRSKSSRNHLQLKTSKRTGSYHQDLLNPTEVGGLLKKLMIGASPPDGAVLDKNTPAFTIVL